mgnify:CR=1 FL=1
MGATVTKRNPIAEAFGIVLRNARTAAGLSQEQLGLACGIDRTYVSLLERGLRQPTLTTIFLVAKHLRVSPAELVILTGKMAAPR